MFLRLDLSAGIRNVQVKSNLQLVELLGVVIDLLIQGFELCQRYGIVLLELLSGLPQLLYVFRNFLDLLQSKDLRLDPFSLVHGKVELLIGVWLLFLDFGSRVRFVLSLNGGVLADLGLITTAVAGCIDR